MWAIWTSSFKPMLVNRLSPTSRSYRSAGRSAERIQPSVRILRLFCKRSPSLSPEELGRSYSSKCEACACASTTGTHPPVGAISSERCWDSYRLSPTSPALRAEFEVLIKHMIQEDYFIHGRGLLSMGNKRVGVRARTSWNFMRSSVAHLYKCRLG